MAHLLFLDLPGGNDASALHVARSLGHRITLASATIARYRDDSRIAPLVDRWESLPADGTLWPGVLAKTHAQDAFDAVLCLQDLRLVEAAAVAKALGLRHLSPDTALLCRDKSAVRVRLAACGLTQAPFRPVAPDDAPGLIAAVQAVGFPAIIKPIDGFGSQHVFSLRSEADLPLLHALAAMVAHGPGEYGLGVVAHGGMLVERQFAGPVLGCDVLRGDDGQALLGVYRKVIAPWPSFVVTGGCYTVNIGQFAALDHWLTRVLDAVGFDFGVAHVECAMTPHGPELIEINPRLVGAGIAGVTDAARGGSIHAAVIEHALTGALPAMPTTARHAATRWLCAQEEGELQQIDWADCADPGLITVVPHAVAGDAVRPPLDNADRLAMVLTAGDDPVEAEHLAEWIVATAKVRIKAPASCTG